MTENNILTCGNAVSQVPILPWNCHYFSSCFLHFLFSENFPCWSHFFGESGIKMEQFTSKPAKSLTTV